jgi:hypothetical protein
MKLTIVVLFCFLCAPAAFGQSDREKLPTSVLLMLNRRFPGWKFAEVSTEVKQFLKQEMKGASPVVISGDFDGNRRRDHAALIHYGYYPKYPGQAIASPRHYLVIFLRRGTGYKLHVIKEPNGEYIGLAKKGTHDYNYNIQKEITYVNDAIFTGIFEKGGSSYVYWRGRFYSFISSD